MFSCIICTYNPDLRLIERAIRSVLDQKTDSAFELIIVDNNSSNNFKESEVIKTLLNKSTVCRVVSEKEQGLAYARITGVNASKYNVIVFVDDDNELDPFYLSNAKELIAKEKEVMIWGAGKIEVDLIDGCESWIKDYMMDFYQFRNFKEIKKSRDEKWQDFYPVGSGMIIMKEAFIRYQSAFVKGELSSTGRKGNSLLSGEDSQMIWLTLLNGGYVASAPDLRLTHIIPKKRTSMSYLMQLNFNLSMSFYRSFLEVYKKPYTKQGRIKFTSFVKLFFECIGNCHYNLSKACKVYNVKKMWYIGYNQYLKEQA